MEKLHSAVVTLAVFADGGDGKDDPFEHADVLSEDYIRTARAKGCRR
ncbi:hypothetical protein [Rouxiella badensis]|nr:hypothetical protein [Rouxiella badensis]